jgi:hypothetical protein
MTFWGDIFYLEIVLGSKGGFASRLITSILSFLPLLGKYHIPKLRSSFVSVGAKIRSKQEISFVPEGNKKEAFEAAMNYGKQCQNIF